MRSLSRIAACLLLCLNFPVAAHAGMGNRGITPKYRPDPCHGDACRADDERSGLPCQGLLCSFSTAKAMQPPVTATQADAQRAAATAADVKPIEVVPPSKPAQAGKKRAKAVAAKKVSAKTDRTANPEK